MPLRNPSRIVTCIAAVAGAMALASCSGPGGTPAEEAAPAQPAAMTQEQRVARGEYLVKVIGCGDCHTPGSFSGAPDAGRWLSGTEYGWVGPWGTTYGKNLTPDSTGLAAWTEDDIVGVLKTGTRKDGSKVLPPMPWPWFSNLSDEDAHAIAAYLKSIPPVEHVVPAALPPGKKAKGPTIAFPAPAQWDLPAAAQAK